MTKRQPVKGAAAFSKTIAVLQLIADSEHPLTSAELVKITKIPRPTMRRILKALVAEDMAEVRPGKTFVLGTRNIELARKAIDQNLLLQTISEDLNWLSSETEASIYLGIPMGNEFIYIANRGEAQVPLGSFGCYHVCAIAKAYLAFVAEDHREQIINSIETPPLTEHNPTRQEQLRAELKETATNGYSIANQQFNKLGQKWLGACIFDAQKTPCAGIGLNMVLSQTDAARNSSLLSSLLQCRDQINQKLKQSEFKRSLA